jgi:hypothetical protein
MDEMPRVYCAAGLAALLRKARSGLENAEVVPPAKKSVKPVLGVNFFGERNGLGRAFSLKSVKNG